MTTFGSFIFSLGVALSGLFGYHQVAPALGAALPSATANFETSLASPITSTATSLTLTANAVLGGGAISGFNCFVIDEGSAQSETACGTVSGTVVTALQRGISQSTGTTTVAALQFSHRRGADVKIADYPLLQILKAQNNGEDTYPNILNYTSAPSFLAPTNIVTKGYVDGIAFGGAGVIAATTNALGTVQLATPLQVASSTANGSAGPVVIPASDATSTYNTATAPLKVVVTQNSGRIDPNFISSLATTTTVGTIPLAQLGKQMQVFSSTGSTTFAVPTGVSFVHVRLIGAGGGPTGGGNGTWSTFGTNGFYCSGNGGSQGSGGGGVGGTATGGDINITGGTGQQAISSVGSMGGSGAFGNGGFGAGAPGGSSVSSGGAGGYCEKYVNVNATTSIQLFVGSGGGTQGIVIVEY